MKTGGATIKGVLFDKDGTLIDFTATWREAIEKIASHLAGGDADLTLTLCDAVGYDMRTQVFLPGSPVVAGSVDMVATHDAEATAHANIKTLGVDDLFDFVAGYDSGYGHKPGPGMPNAFAAAIGADPSETVMVGDSVHDLGAGRAAGCALCVGVLTGPADEAELAPEGDMVLPSIADLPDVLAGRLKPT